MAEVTTPAVLLALEHVSLEREGRFILRDVSLSVRHAERLALVGGNGAGKSTLLTLLTGQARSPSAWFQSSSQSSSQSSWSQSSSDGSSSEVTVSGQVWRAPGVRVMTLPNVGAFAGTAQGDTFPKLGQESNAGQQDASQQPVTVADVAQVSLRELQRLEQDMRKVEQRLGQFKPTDPRLQAALENYAVLQERFERAGGYDTPQRIEQALAAFGLEADQLLEHLSPAQRQQLALALGLLRAKSFADVLLLDEPERHLDLSSRQQLVAALQALPVAVVFASHDRALLDAVAKRVAYVADGGIQLYRGNYSAFLRQHDSERVRLARLAHKRHQERQALEQTRRAAPTPDARKRARERLDKLEPVPAASAATAISSLPLGSLPLGSLPLGYETRPAEILLRVQKLFVRQLENLSFQLTAGTTVALLGAHGAGKTTLLETIAGRLEPHHPDSRIHWARDAKLAYFDAEAGLDDAPLLGQLEAFVAAMRARSLLALVGLAEYADKTPAQLSSGQRARAGLAKVMAQDATVLLLDNPSEHLDLNLTAVLENALLDSPAAILLATHDAALIERVADQVWCLEAGRLSVYANLAAYQRGEALPNLAEAHHDPAQAVLLADNEVSDTAEPITPAEIAAREAALEQQLATFDDALLDPLRHSERERERVTLRRKQVIDELSWCYEQRQPAPLPAYGAREGTVQVWLDIDNTNGVLDNKLNRKISNNLSVNTDNHQAIRVATFNSNVPVQGRVFIQQRTGHVQWQLPEASCVLPWALERVAWGLMRIVFMHLELQVVQTQHMMPLPNFQDAGEGWQTLTRKDFAQLEGYGATALPKQRAL